MLDAGARSLVDEAPRGEARKVEGAADFVVRAGRARARRAGGGTSPVIGGAGKADSMLLASEPLTRDVSTWVEVPEYSLVYATGEQGHGFVRTIEVDA